MSRKEQLEKAPVFPRRAFVAAGLSAVLAGAIVSLGIIGVLNAPHQEVFQFSRGLVFASDEEPRLRGFLARTLTDDRYYVVILGHTGDAGEADANLQLSSDRAALVATMAQELGVPLERVFSQGVGGASPLARNEGESARAYQSRLARVEVTLQMRR